VKQTIRIIGGKYRGKKLHFPDSEGLRPTPDRVRETLFNWLMSTIRGARCLDAFAGSGALGFEAWSRGASNVVLIEHAPQVFANLKNIAATFNSPNLSVVCADAGDYMQKACEPFDVIFLDPPFSQNNIPQYLTILAKSSILPVGGLVYIESAKEIIPDPAYWQKIKLKHAGQVVYGMYKKHASGDSNG